jgi:hypothetical protein
MARERAEIVNRNERSIMTTNDDIESGTIWQRNGKICAIATSYVVTEKE